MRKHLHIRELSCAHSVELCYAEKCCRFLMGFNMYELNMYFFIICLIICQAETERKIIELKRTRTSVVALFYLYVALLNWSRLVLVEVIYWSDISFPRIVITFDLDGWIACSTEAELLHFPFVFLFCYSTQAKTESWIWFSSSLMKKGWMYSIFYLEISKQCRWFSKYKVCLQSLCWENKISKMQCHLQCICSAMCSAFSSARAVPLPVSNRSAYHSEASVLVRVPFTIPDAVRI